MWTCSYCKETTDDDSWEVCWKCNTSRNVSAPEALELKNQIEQQRKKFQDCLRCGTRMQYGGVRKFHEGPRWGALGDITELFVNKESYVTYVCPNCGKIELYEYGTGNDLRGDPTDDEAQITEVMDANLPFATQPPDTAIH